MKKIRLSEAAKAHFQQLRQLQKGSQVTTADSPSDERHEDLSPADQLAPHLVKKHGRDVHWQVQYPLYYRYLNVVMTYFVLHQLCFFWDLLLLSFLFY